MSAIKVVTAFGMETQEKLNYTKYLEQAKKAGFNSRLFNAAVVGFFFMVIFGSYAYAFYIGSQFIEHDVYNTAQKRTYSGGDVLSTFLGVIIGVFSLGQTMN